MRSLDTIISFISISADDLLLNPKDHPDAKIGDVVEIYHPEDESTRLLLQITCFNEDIKGTRGMRNLSTVCSTLDSTNTCENRIFRSD